MRRPRWLPENTHSFHYDHITKLEMEEYISHNADSNKARLQKEGLLGEFRLLRSRHISFQKKIRGGTFADCLF